MSISKLTLFSLSTLFLIILLQISNAGNKLENKTNNTQTNSIVNIIDPAIIAGTEVRLKDLF
jgi:hypothetical protein